MRFKAYQGARPGIASLIGAATAPGGSTYNTTMRDLAYVDSARASAGRDESEAMLNRQRYDARGGLEQALAGVPMPEGWNTNALAGLFRASENPNLTDVTKGIGDLRTDEARRGALAAQGMGDTESMNQLVAIAQGDQYAPWALNETGRLNTTTGQVDFTPGHGALTAQRHAAARESDADARAADALTRQRGFLEISPGASIYDIATPPQGPQAAPAAPGGVMAAMQSIAAPAASPAAQGPVLDAFSQVPMEPPPPTATPGGPQLVATAPVPAGAAGGDKVAAREAAQIAEAQALYGLSPQDATALVRGWKRITRNEVTGQSFIVDLATGQQTELGATPTQPAAPAEPAPPGESQRPELTPLWDQAEGVSGVGPSMKAALSGPASQVLGPEAAATGIIGARQNFANAKNDLIRALSINPRYPVGEIKRLEGEINITPNAWDSDTTLRTKMVAVDQYLRNRLINERAAQGDTSLPAEDRKAAASAAQQIENFLSVLGVPENPSVGGGPAPGHVEDGYQFMGGDPANPSSWKPVQ